MHKAKVEFSTMKYKLPCVIFLVAENVHVLQVWLMSFWMKSTQDLAAQMEKLQVTCQRHIIMVMNSNEMKLIKKGNSKTSTALQGIAENLE